MLRSELPFAIEGRLRGLSAVLLGEPFLGFLAIVALGLTLFPMLFPVSSAVEAAIDAAQWGIIGWFAFEFVFAFAAAPHKRQFLTSPWRWLDFVTIAIALGSLLPSASPALRSSPILRLARLGRLLSLGLRASGVSARRRTLQAAQTRQRGPARVTLVADEPEVSLEPADLSEVLRWLESPDEQWFHVTNPSLDESGRIEAAAGLPAGYLETHLLETRYPHWAPAGGRTGLFLWAPDFDGRGSSERHGMFLLPTGEGLLSLSRRELHTVERLARPPSMAREELPFAVRMVVVALERVVRVNELLAGDCEVQLRELEDVSVDESRPAFFERTFRLKKLLSAAIADLWRLKGIAADLESGRVQLATRADAVATQDYRHFADRVAYLYDTLANIREEVLSVIDLHLNVVSFEMNRVMRVLAVVSALGLIPAVVGGLLGMNLIDNPWPVTLPQIAFAVLFAMVLGLYFFIVKGWLR